MHLHIRPADAAASGPAQARSVYEALARALDSQGGNVNQIVSETVFVRPQIADLDGVLEARLRVLADAGRRGPEAALTLIGQAPLKNSREDDEVPCLELAAVAILSHEGEVATSVHCPASCSCGDCAPGRSGRVTPAGARTLLHAGNIRGCGDGARAEAFDMFVEAERLLDAAGMTFRDVIRTWIYLRDIGRDYDALNDARRDFFDSRGIERRPASTGVQGDPMAAGHDFAMAVFAVRGTHSEDVPLMSTPLLNEAWTYGADFSRGLRLVDEDKVSLIVSGTASIDERGRSLHEGDLRRQADRMLDNIATLLDEQGAGFGDLVSGVTYVRDALDAPALRRMLDEHKFGGFPLAVVEAPLCRPELLCETEVVAVLPASDRD